LRLLRVGDRNLVQTIQRGLFLRAMDNYDADAVAQDTGEEVWKGTVEIEPDRNKRVTTLVPIVQMVSDMKSGVYLLVATRTDGGEDRYGYKATQWLIVTDIGLTTMSGTDGLNVFLRSLDSAKALEKIPSSSMRATTRSWAAPSPTAPGEPTLRPGCCVRRTVGRQRRSWPSARTAISPSSI
jgi:alpha-2-macroglobulin